MTNPYEHNRTVWNQEVANHNQWTVPVDAECIERARRADWRVLLTPMTPVPRAWFGNLEGQDVLGLASGGGQQCPIFAAAGARVVSFDASEAQLAQDTLVANRDGLTLRTVQGNMKDLSAFGDDSFDLVFNPCSTCFVDDVEVVWREVARVLRPNGVLLTGFVHPWFYLFDAEAFDRDELRVAHRLPFRSDRDGAVKPGELIEFSHSLDAQLGGQLRAGLSLTDLFEDDWDAWRPLQGRAKAFIATRSVRRAR